MLSTERRWPAGFRGAAGLALVGSALASTGVLADPLSGSLQPSERNWLLGDWALDAAGCRRPDFSFGTDTAVISLDADGAPVSFAYPQVSYEVSGVRASVSLGKKHPLARTSSKTQLIFVREHEGVAILERVRGAGTAYVRCPVAETK